MASKELQRLWDEHVAAPWPVGLPERIGGEDATLAITACNIAVSHVLRDRAHYSGWNVPWWQIRRRVRYALHKRRVLGDAIETFAAAEQLDLESRVYVERLRRIAELALATRTA